MLKAFWQKGGGAKVYRTAAIWGMFVWGGMLYQNHRLGVFQEAIEKGIGWPGLIAMFLVFNLVCSAAVVIANGYWFSPERFGGAIARAPVLSGLFHAWIAIATSIAALALIKALAQQPMAPHVGP
jgi:hypothetical protein